MQPRKYIWMLRALLYKLTFKRIGNLTYIGKPIFTEGRKNIAIGKRVRIYPGIRLETIDGGQISIGNNVAIEQNVQIVSMKNKLVIGDDVTIAGNTFISNVNHNYADVHHSVMDQGYTVKKTIIGKSCFIGYGTVILPGTELGNHCIVGSNSVLTGQYADYSLIVGAPGRIIKKYNFNLNIWERSDK